MPQMDNIVRSYVTRRLPEDIAQLRAMARAELYSGPITSQDFKDSGYTVEWPGYNAALSKLRDWAEDNIQSLWYSELDMDVYEAEEEGAVEVPSHLVQRLVFGVFYGNGW